LLEKEVHKSQDFQYQRKGSKNNFTEDHLYMAKMGGQTCVTHQPLLLIAAPNVILFAIF
jgi:hypothetical protein